MVKDDINDRVGKILEDVLGPNGIFGELLRDRPVFRETSGRDTNRRTNPYEIDRAGDVLGVSKHMLRGDYVELEPTEQDGKKVMKVRLPNSQVIRIPDETRGQAYRYSSPTDQGKRIVYGAYVGGRCKIVIAR